jgi:signal transduction histidine kinase
MLRGSRSKSRQDRPRLVLRFAVWALLAFIVVGTLISFEAVHEVRHRAEDLATKHAEFAGNAVLSPMLQGVNLTQPLSAQTIAQLDQVVRTRILADGMDVRIKIWRPDGTIEYSDAHALIGRRFPEEADSLQLVMQGQVSSEISDLNEAENVLERPLATKLFATYVPMHDAGGNTVAVAELYQRYAVIDGDVRDLIRNLAMVFIGGLLLLYAATIPIARSGSRALREANARLRAQTAQLEELLAREQDTVAELRELDRMKNEFVSAASHELRTPLTAIIGTLHTLEQPEIAADQQTRSELLLAARQRAENLFRLVRNLLRSAHMEGPPSLATEEINLGQVVAAATADLPDAMGRVHTDLVVDGTIRADRERLEDILSNLIENALKFSPADSPVDVVARSREGLLIIGVRDHGIGIDPEEVDGVFERFHQVDQSATRRFGGLGLGLHLVRELAVDLGGTVSVASTVGEGSVFTVTIPLEPATMNAEAQPVS